MVLESIIAPWKAKKKPWQMLIIGFVYSTVAIFLSLWIFERHASLVMVFLTVLACAPIMYLTMKLEEGKDLEIESEKTILKEHGKALLFLICMFAGACIAYAFWYVALSPSMVHSLFSIQTQTIADINQQVTGGFHAAGMFTKIFLNNLKVLIFCVLFSFIYGLGAIFILIWNASVIGAAIGNFIRGHMASYTGAVGVAKLGGYAHIGSLGILRYFIHGLPEILAYFVGGLAGSIISVAIIKHDFGTKKFEKIVLDASDLIILAILILLISALIEVYITPAFF